MSSATQPSERQPLILCIDDYAAGTHVRKLLLEQCGYAVLTAASGEEGLAMLSCLQVGSAKAVIVDYSLPGISGEDLTRIVKMHWPEVPVIMLSGNPGIPISARRCADAFLVKGAGNEQLRAKLAELLGSSSPTERRTKIINIAEAFSSGAAPGKRNLQKH
jgi:CheY-like chemotaxis protein